MGTTWSLKGKTCLITGATLGIGRITAQELARLGPTLVLCARDGQRGAAVVSEIKAASGNPNIELLVGDLSIQSDVRRVAAEFRQRHQQLHVLINNAGAMFNQRQLSVDGIEQTFALNHVAYFLLTDLLLDLLTASGGSGQQARIINVASRAHSRVKSLRFDDLLRERSYSGFGVYSESKLANILFTYELARRLQAAGAPVTANCLHPGFVKSGFGHNNSKLFALLIQTAASIVGISPEEGAKTTIYLASSAEVEGVTGKYFDKSRERSSNAASHDRQAATRLWELSERWVGGKPSN
jgi:NAD(P)-dependent dehydrogenase (short-subunit alcohol dehydrogenase family)